MSNQKSIMAEYYVKGLAASSKKKKNNKKKLKIALLQIRK
jgi:hypothetical protein